jgi:hypothetical protein
VIPQTWNNLRACLASCLLLIMAGCQGSSYFEATPTAAPDNARVYIYRPAATNPGAKPLRFSYPEVMIDGASKGLLKYKEYLELEIAAGKREFVVTGLTPNAKWKPRDVSYTLTVEPGKTYYMRLRIEYDLDRVVLRNPDTKYLIHLHPVAAKDAVYEIRDTAASTP